MALIKSKWTNPERLLHNFLKGKKIRHKMHPKIYGSPDVLLLDNNTTIFIQGCFWHGCKKHYKKPKTNEAYWISKINGNMNRDKLNTLRLKNKGYGVTHIWEHDIRNNFKGITHEFSNGRVFK